MSIPLLVLCFIFLTKVTAAQEYAPAGDIFYKNEIVRYVNLLDAARQPTVDANIDVTYYNLDLNVITDPNYLYGIVTVKAISLSPQLTAVSLNLINSMTVDSIRIAGTNAAFTHSASTLHITLDRSYAFNEMIVLQIAYQGLPSPTGFGSFVFSSHSGVPWVWSLSQPYGARDWWPCKDHPLDKADSVDIRITCRDDFKVGSNGRLVNIVDNGNGTRTWQWAERYPIATYLVSVAMTNYAEFSNWFHYSPTDSMEILNYVLPEHLSHGLANLPRTVDMLEIFSDLFGLYPFINEKYGHSQFGWGGAMEHQTMTSLTYNAFAEYVVAHELAHQWFGDLITCANWPNIWMNEGFATYCEALYFERKYGEERYWQDMLPKMNSAKTAVGTLHVQDTTGTGTLFNTALVYRKGASVLHMLRHVLGDSVFFAAMKAYATHPDMQYGVTTTEDFRNICEAVSGTDLGYFFNQWIYGERYPEYSYSWFATPAGGGHDITIRVHQTTGTTNPSFFTMPVDLRIGNEVTDTTVVVFHTYSGEEFMFHVPFAPTFCTLDPDNWILKTTVLVPVHAEEQTRLPEAVALRQNYPNPFNPATVIEFEVARPSHVRLVVNDLLGRTVATLVDDALEPGVHEAVFSAERLAAGVYFYTLATSEARAVRRMVLLR